MADCRQCADFDWCAEHEDCGLFKQKPITQADRIRAMSDEELAWFLDFNVKIMRGYGMDSHEKWEAWLKQEADNG